jgi:hypothetical protein
MINLRNKCGRTEVFFRGLLRVKRGENISFPNSNNPVSKYTIYKHAEVGMQAGSC